MLLKCLVDVLRSGLVGQAHGEQAHPWKAPGGKERSRHEGPDLIASKGRTLRKRDDVAALLQAATHLTNRPGAGSFVLLVDENRLVGLGSGADHGNFFHTVIRQKHPADQVHRQQNIKG